MNECHSPQSASLIARPALMDGRGPRISGSAVASPSATDSPLGCLPNASASGGEPEKDLLQLVEHAQGAEMNPPGIVVSGEAESMVGPEPAVIGIPAGRGSVNRLFHNLHSFNNH